jgi:Protein of unknown function (DUF2911)
MKRMFLFFFAISLMSSAVLAQAVKPAKANVPAAKPAKAAEKMVEKTADKPAEKAKPSPAASATGKSGDANIAISYAQPAVKGRKVWGDLVPFDKVWRTGANEATTIEFSKDVKVEGKALKAGKYALFTIPTEGGDWTIIFNKTAKQWGSYDYKEADDALRVKVKAGKAAAFAERLTFDVKDKNVSLAWENLSVGFKVE